MEEDLLHVPLLATASSDLRWTRALPSSLLQDERRIFWELDLGLEQPFFPFEDTLFFSALSLALSTFSQELYQQFAKRTAGVRLFRGSADRSVAFQWTDTQEKNWQIWREGRPLARIDHLRRLFCMDVLVYYVQMLSTKLPDEMPIWLFFQAEGCGSRAESEQLFSKERFSYFHLHIEDLPAFPEAAVAVCFPEEGLCSEVVLSKMDALFETIEPPFRVIQEPFLLEEGQGVDRLYVLTDALSQRGKRQLQGFLATGAEVIYC